VSSWNPTPSAACQDPRKHQHVGADPAPSRGVLLIILLITLLASEHGQTDGRAACGSRTDTQDEG
jgi:hypothetical protein